MNEQKKKERLVSLDEAAHQVRLVSERLGLLHLCFAKTLVTELGEQEGKRLILKAIKRYGTEIGKRVRQRVLRQGLSFDPENYGKGGARDLPEFGMHDRIREYDVEGERRIRAEGCSLAKVWREYGEDKLGRLYCFVDVAKYMAFNPDYKMVHTACIADGDKSCELAVRRTTEKERTVFESDDDRWKDIDKG